MQDDPLCAYSDVLGKPNEGVHSYRVFGFAAVDVIGTILIIVLLSLLWNPVAVTAFTIVTFIFVHWVFCVPTALNKALGLA